MSRKGALTASNSGRFPAVVAPKPPAVPGNLAASSSNGLFTAIEVNGGGDAKIRAWVESMRASSPTQKTTPLPGDHRAWMTQHPSALDMFEQITKVSKGKKIVMFLDYDGTLSPIVDNPDAAYMSDAMRATVRNLASYFPTAIVTGRCIDKVFSFVQLAELYYAGSHGMDIKGPESKKDRENIVFQPAKEFLPMIEEVYKILVVKTSSTPGVLVENNKFCVSVHFRCVDDKKWEKLAKRVASVLEEYPKLRLTHGRKVLEVRPAIAWDKGKALNFLLQSLGYANSNTVCPVYIGDDKTDEDAFKVLKESGKGFGIVVSKVPRDTHATYSLQEPSEVMHFLHRLVEWKRQTHKGSQEIRRR
ncbi:unnamed protein product [Cuscuta campestris]|uniref:Trehalose 6-phosphate phosphatase n=1 Tax=Cuscuta campestris TaxID=132261 RepID=A0A484L1I3_9ASTE|nr:unnamed protein product [Cuscuta campestris]